MTLLDMAQVERRTGLNTVTIRRLMKRERLGRDIFRGVLSNAAWTALVGTFGVISTIVWRIKTLPDLWKGVFIGGGGVLLLALLAAWLYACRRAHRTPEEPSPVPQAVPFEPEPAPSESMNGLRDLADYWFSALASAMAFLEELNTNGQREAVLLLDAVRELVGTYRIKLQEVARTLEQPITQQEFGKLSRDFLSTVTEYNNKLLAWIEKAGPALGGEGIFSTARYEALCQSYADAFAGTRLKRNPPEVGVLTAALKTMKRPQPLRED
jgi:FAD/FMN-containing dehydrogenase